MNFDYGLRYTTPLFDEHGRRVEWQIVRIVERTRIGVARLAVNRAGGLKRALENFPVTLYMGDCIQP